MTIWFILLAAVIVAALFAGFRIGVDYARRAIERGAYWNLTHEQQATFDDLMALALKRVGEE